MRIVRHELGIPVGLINPSRTTAAFELSRNASFVRQVRTGVLAASQFNDVLTDGHGLFRKLASW